MPGRVERWWCAVKTCSAVCWWWTEIESAVVVAAASMSEEEQDSIVGHLKIYNWLSLSLSLTRNRLLCVFPKQLHRRSHSQYNKIVITTMTYKFLFYYSIPHIFLVKITSRNKLLNHSGMRKFHPMPDEVDVIKELMEVS
jgi:hypothetical protein